MIVTSYYSLLLSDAVNDVTEVLSIYIFIPYATS